MMSRTIVTLSVDEVKKALVAYVVAAAPHLQGLSIGEIKIFDGLDDDEEEMMLIEADSDRETIEIALETATFSAEG